MTEATTETMTNTIINLVCATTNTDKAAEIADMLSGVAVLLPRPDGVGHVDENASDLLGNAILKASAVSCFAMAAAVADDTGLEVDALQGAPGVFSSRYAGPDASYADNVNKLLHDIEGVPQNKRTAQFRTVAVVCWPDGKKLVAEGRVKGTITTEPRGLGGFGYDTVFVPEETVFISEETVPQTSHHHENGFHGFHITSGHSTTVQGTSVHSTPVLSRYKDSLVARTFAEMSAAEKNLISHRGRAFKSLARMLVNAGLS